MPIQWIRIEVTMNHRCSAFIVCFVTFWLGACTADMGETDAPSLFPTPTSAPVDQMAYPRDTRTGIATIDSVIEAALVDDRSALVDYTVTACTKVDGLGGAPKCGEGQRRERRSKCSLLWGQEKDRTPIGKG